MVWHDANSTPVAPQEFQSLFCQRFNCPTSEYDERAFRECLYWHARPLAPVLRRVKPDFFAEDFKFIGYLGEATGVREARANAADFQDANLGRRSFWRRRLKIRCRAERQPNWLPEENKGDPLRSRPFLITTNL